MPLPTRLALMPQPGWPGALLAGLLMLAILAGHDGTRVAQLLVLALPGLLWLRWPLKSQGWRLVRGVTLTLACGLFLLDGLVRGALSSTYQVLPDSAVVLAAMANTTEREALEYLQANRVILGLTLGLALLGLGVMAALVRACNRHQLPVGRLGRGLMLLLLLVCSLAYASAPWRRHHPAVFWPNWVNSVSTLRESWSDQHSERQQLMANNALAAAPQLSQTGPSTVVLVLTDSVNRDNMSLYGYARDTTPQLTAFSQAESQRWLTLRHAWSVAPGTMDSLSGLFSFGARGPGDPVGEGHHLLALARAAGYRVWWLSNHDDLAIDQQHAQLADTVVRANRAPGRSSVSLDGVLLDGLERALTAPAPHKLIVLHLLGAHPHYRLRSPTHPFEAGGDAVDAELQRAGRPLWLRELRQDYDAAVAYQDMVVAKTVALTRQHAPAGGTAAWMFLSDHGQEVGHAINFAGHSPGTPAGYRIPALLWHSQGGLAPASTQQPFRADWAAWPLADLLGLEWDGMLPERNVLRPQYRWQAPELPLANVRFDQ